MRKILLLILISVGLIGNAQFGGVHTYSSQNTLETALGGLKVNRGIINTIYPDTATANLQPIKTYPAAQIWVNDTLYLRNSTATKWMAQGAGGGGGGSGLFPTTGTGTATGNVTGDIGANTLNITGSAGSAINSTADTHQFITDGEQNLLVTKDVSLIRGMNPTGGENFARFRATGDVGSAFFELDASFDGGATQAGIEGTASTGTSSLTYTAGIHTFNGNDFSVFSGSTQMINVDLVDDRVTMQNLVGSRIRVSTDDDDVQLRYIDDNTQIKLGGGVSLITHIASTHSFISGGEQNLKVTLGNSLLRSFDATGGGNTGLVMATSTATTSEVAIAAQFNAVGDVASILLHSESGLSSITHLADVNTFNGDFFVNDLAGFGSGIVAVDNAGQLSFASSPISTASEGLVASSGDVKFGGIIGSPTTFSVERTLNVNRKILHFTNGIASEAGGAFWQFSQRPFSPYQFISQDTVSVNDALPTAGRPLSGLYARRTLYFNSGIHKAQQVYGHYMGLTYNWADTMVLRNDGMDYGQALIAESRYSPRNSGHQVIRFANGTGNDARKLHASPTFVANVYYDGKDGASTDTLRGRGVTAGIISYLVAATASGKIRGDEHVFFQAGSNVNSTAHFNRTIVLARQTNEAFTDTAYFLWDTLRTSRNMLNKLVVGFGDSTQSGAEFKVYGSSLHNGWSGYFANVAANYTARSFTDKNYVDSAILIASPSIYTTNGTLSSDRTVTQSSKFLKIVQGSDTTLLLNPVTFNSLMKSSDGTAYARLSLTGNLVGNIVTFNLGANDGTNLVSVSGNAQTNAITYLAGSNLFAGDVRPSVDNSFNLGSASFQWKDFYVKGTSTFTALAGNGSGFVAINNSGVISWGASGITDADKGDITVSSSGSVFTIDNSVVTMAKLSTTGTPNGTKFLRDDGQWTTISGGGDALTTNPLSQFAATTSAQLAGVLSDEIGSVGFAVFATGTTGTTSSNIVFSASPTFTGTVTIPTPFTIGAVSMTSTGTQLNYLNAATGTTGTASTNVVFSASPTFTGTVTIPTSFVLGATTVTTTGTQLNYINAATGTTGTTSTNIVFSASPTFTGTVTIPTPFTLGATSVTSTGTQLNYLNAATGTTGTASTNVVFSAGPTFTGTITASIIAASGFSTFTGGLSSGAVAGNSNFYVTGGITANRSTTASLLPLAAAGVGLRAMVNGTTAYTMTASDAFGSFVIGTTGGVTEAGSGTHPIVASLVVLPITVTNAAGATDILAGVYIGGPATGVTAATASYGLWVDAGNTRLDGSLLQGQGADVGSANNLVVGNDGNTFEITGTTQINLISNLGFQNGTVIHLQFTSTPTVKNGQATSTTNITILLAGAADFSATANDVLTLVLGEIGGTQAWREVSRSVN